MNGVNLQKVVLERQILHLYFIEGYLSMAIVKKLSAAIAGAAFSALCLGLEAARAHGGHLNSDSEHSHSDSGQPHSSVDPRLGSDSIFYGEGQPLGNGTVRTWVKLDSEGNASDIGVSFTEAALSGLPKQSEDFEEYPLKLTLLDGIGSSTFEYELLFPQEAEATPFTHMSLNWNPQGHAPEGATTVPHFDFHFNMLTPEERDAIGAEAPDDFLEKAYKLPPAELVPEGYVALPMAAEPRMGLHLVDPASPEFQRPFDRVFIYGSYDGEMVFWEPMVATSFLETKANTTDAIKQPPSYPQSGYYPTAYSVNYVDGQYSVSLNGLTFRSSTSASVPEPSSMLGVFALGGFGAGSLLERRQKQTAQGSDCN